MLTVNLQARGGLDGLREDVKLLTELTVVIFQMQHEMGRWLAFKQRPRLGQVREFAIDVALAAYRARVALDHLYADHRGVAGAAQEGHVVALPFDDVYAGLTAQEPDDDDAVRWARWSIGWPRRSSRTASTATGRS